MAWYVVSYDLRTNTEREDYERIHAALRTATDYCWPLLSFWIVETPLSPRGVINALLDAGAIDDNDGIVVLEITLSGDFRRLEQQQAIEWMRSHIVRF